MTSEASSKSNTPSVAPAKKIASSSSSEQKSPAKDLGKINYRVYKGEHELDMLQELIKKDLSEPYSIYTYRYFLHGWPELCYLAMVGDQCVGTIVCRLERESRTQLMSGYIAMLAVDSNFRKRGIGTKLVKLAVMQMKIKNADEIVLEAEVSNRGALALYENLGFVRELRLSRYYMSGSDAFRLKLWLKPPNPNVDPNMAMY